MITVKVLRPCINRETLKQMNPGTILEMTEERYNSAPSGCLEVVAAKAPAPKKGRKKNTETK